MEIKWLILLLMLTSCMHMAQMEDSNSDEQEQPLLKLFFKQENRFILGPEKDIVLVIGVAGSGTTTLTSLLVGVELRVKNHSITDNFDFIGTLNPIVPRSMFDNTNDIAYYDYPGFSDSRDVNTDIVATFTFRKLLDFAERVKFVFTCSYGANANQFTKNLEKLLTHVSDFFIDLEKYRDAIALVVTKVPNSLSEKEVNEQIHRSFQTLVTGNTGNEKQIRFAEILQWNNFENYTKIGIFRTPSESAQFELIESVQDNRVAITNIVKNNLHYADNLAKDFHISLAQKSKSQISSVEKYSSIRNEFIEYFEHIQSETRNFLVDEEKQHARNLQQSIGAMQRINKKLLKIQSNDLEAFKHELAELIDDSKISTSDCSSRKIIQCIEFLDFINTYSGEKIFGIADMFNLVTNLKTYVSDSLKWYKFLMDLLEKLELFYMNSQFDIYNTYEWIDNSEITNTTIDDENEVKKVSDLNIDLERMDAIDPTLYSNVEHLSVNKYKLDLLKAVWHQLTKLETIERRPDETCVVKGYMVSVRRLFHKNCLRSKHVHIFALNKVLIDCFCPMGEYGGGTTDIAVISPFFVKIREQDGFYAQGISNDTSAYNRILTINWGFKDITNSSKINPTLRVSKTTGNFRMTE